MSNKSYFDRMRPSGGNTPTGPADFEGDQASAVPMPNYTRYSFEVNIAEVAGKNGKASHSLKQILEMTLIKAKVSEEAFFDRFVDYIRDVNLNPKATEEAIHANALIRFKEMFEADTLTWENFQIGMAFLGFKHLLIEGV